MNPIDAMGQWAKATPLAQMIGGGGGGNGAPRRGIRSLSDTAAPIDPNDPTRQRRGLGTSALVPGLPRLGSQ